MWLLIFILHGEPYQVKKIEVLGTYSYRHECESDVKEMLKHIKNKLSIGCVPLLGVKKV